MNNARKWQTEHVHIPQQPKKKILVKVKKRGWITKGEKVIYSSFAVALIFASLYFVSFASKTDMLNREVLALENQVYNQKLENKTLYFEVSELSKPDRITKIAKEHGLKIQDAKVMQATTENN